MPGPYRWRKRVEGHFCRWTMPREAILDLLTRTSQHLTALCISSSTLPWNWPNYCLSNP